MFTSDRKEADQDLESYSPLCRSHGGAEVLALLPDPMTARLCLDLAEDAAHAIHGCMAAAHIGSEPMTLVFSAEEIDLIQLRDHAEGSSRQRFEQVNQAFVTWRRRDPQRRTVFLDDCRGDVARCVATECAASELVVTSSHGNADAQDAFRSVVFSQHKLVLMPPTRDYYQGNLFGHVVIGWRQHGHAEDTLVAARRWLSAAARITVLCVDDTDGKAKASAEALLERLALHGQVVAMASGSGSIGKAIVDFARTEKATCLLIGAFRHGYVLELLFGRITRYVLSHATMPVMMKH
ncbi:universal stress protein [Rhizobium metallidurans]|uniref:Nucleotide-binding universal stress UspA family protein n=1 Tax=Rhizobium metallidurans TaxID=1265931 RepID=A0A7W6CT38_9HYPH|nr:universal stress protein [Rhizobium metallidurans]MBB3964683.1 nucleotide-binding universal stress UspA family protein [Rhizobium metallidurans]